MNRDKSDLFQTGGRHVRGSGRLWYGLLLPILLFMPALSQAAVDGSYTLFPGHFGTDVYIDIYAQPADDTNPSEMLLGGNPNNPLNYDSAATWNNGYLNLNWSADTQLVQTGDFNGDTFTDVLLQGKSAGQNTAVVLSDGKGALASVASSWSDGALGLNWNASQTNLVLGDFDGDGKTDVLLQPKDNGTSTITLVSNRSDHPDTITQSWSTSNLGLDWGAKSAHIITGDFNGDGKKDLLLFAKQKLIFFPVDLGSYYMIPAYIPNPTNATLLADANGAFTSINQQWAASYLGINWNDTNYDIRVADFNGDGRDDLLLLPRKSTDNAYLLYADVNGKFSAIGQTIPSGSQGVNWSDTQHIVVGDFNRDGKADVVSQSLMSNQVMILYADANGQFSASSPIQTKAIGNPITSALAKEQPPVSLTVPTTTAPVGTIPGKFRVDLQGQADYDIPLVIPPGSGGLQPKLRLSYSSGSVNRNKLDTSVVGMGFTIGGLSRITRCGQTIALDSYKLRVQLNNNDRFCLDGQRLIAMSGSYGADGTIYHTEMETFATIVSHGTQGNGPQYFEVTTKSGTVMEYGYTADSNIVAQGSSTVRVWALDKVTDTSHNYYTVNYNQDSTNGEYSPAEIDYTGNTITGSVPGNLIRFTYVHRSNPISQYVAGSLIKVTQVLTQVSIYNKINMVLVRNYNLTYSGTGAAKLPRLKTVQECGADACLPKTLFTWGTEATPMGSDIVVATMSAACSVCDYVTPSLDFDGDGHPDSYYKDTNGAYHILYNYGSFGGIQSFSSDQVVATATVTSGVTDLPPMHLTGYTNSINENAPDFVYLENGNIHVIVNNHGSVPSFLNDTIWGTYPTVGAIVLGLADVNGDGRPDFVYIDALDTVHVLINTGSQFVASATFSSHALICTATDYLNGVCIPSNAWYIEFTSLRGSRFPDIVSAQGTAGALVASFNYGDLFSYDGQIVVPAKSNTWIAPLPLFDFTGNGLPDFAYPVSGLTGALTLYADTGGNYSLSPYNWSISGQLAYDSHGYRLNYNLWYANFIDLNGDGTPDNFYFNSDGNVYEYNNTGRGFVGSVLTEKAPFDTTATPITIPNQLVADVNNDGLPDIIYINGGHTDLHVLLNTGNGFATDQVWGTTSTPISYSPTTGFSKVKIVDVNGDDIPDLTYVDSANQLHMLPGQAPAPSPNVLTSITNGLGANITITYSTPSTLGYGYGSAWDTYFPYEAVGVTDYLVASKVVRSDGTGGSYGIDYQYERGVADVYGTGWLGFEDVISTDERTGVTTETNLNQRYDGTQGTIKSVVTRDSQGYLLNVKYQDWQAVNMAASNRYYVKLAVLNSSQEKKYEVGAHVVLVSDSTTCTQTTYSYNPFTTAGNYGDYGLPSTVKKQSDKDCSFTDATFTRLTTYTYDHSNGVLGKIAQQQVEYDAPGQPSIVRTTSYGYDNAGRLTSKIIEPELPTNSVLRESETYVPDDYGNRNSTTITGAQPDGSTLKRTSTVYYDGFGIAAVSYMNALNQRPPSFTTYDYRWGRPLTVTDLNGLQTTYRYDGLGRKILKTNPDGTQTAYTYEACNATLCPVTEGGVAPTYRVTTQTTGSAPTRVYYDMLSRQVRKEHVGLNGQIVYQDTVYDNRSNVLKTSHPYFAGTASTAVLWDVNTYDILNRPTSVTEADGRITTTDYAGLTVTATSSVASGVVPPMETRSRTTVQDARGKTVSITDSLYPYQPTTYQYDAAGDVIGVTDPLNNQTTLLYDLRGRKKQLDDPDSGTTLYDYNSVGELITQTDADNHTLTMTYDALGRKRIEDTSTGTHSTWTYDTAPLGSSGTALGFLASESGPDYNASYHYDLLERLSSKSETISGKSFTTAWGYDAYSRPLTLTYPSGFSITNIYNHYGYLSEVDDSGTGAPYWNAVNDEPTGKLNTWTYGNGARTQVGWDPAKNTPNWMTTNAGSTTIADLNYVFDVHGNLQSRTDNVNHFSETYGYDTLNRLTSVTGPAPKTFDYDEIGNIKTKSDMGTYSYGKNAGPHAVTGIDNGTSQRTFTYDAAGNMTFDQGIITYNSYNLPVSVTGTYGSETLEYSPDLKRIKQTTSTSTTLYVGKLYEQVTTGSLVESKHYISDGNNAIAVVTLRNTNINDTQYLHTNYLGTVTAITDENGNTVADSGRLAYDAWGKRRNLNGTDASSPIIVTSPTTRGYTGQEMDDFVGLINLNARLYDPALARFISPDPLVGKGFGQDLNRYTYASNNPLSLMDPTGLTTESGNSGDTTSTDSYTTNTCYYACFWYYNDPQSYNYTSYGVTPSYQNFSFDSLYGSVPVNNFYNMQSPINSESFADNSILLNSVDQQATDSSSYTYIPGSPAPPSDPGSIPAMTTKELYLISEVLDPINLFFAIISGGESEIPVIEELNSIDSMAAMDAEATAASVAKNGSATITRYGKNHFGVEVSNNGTRLNTHQVITTSTGSSTRIVNAADIPPANSATSSVTIPLENASGALSRQTQLLNTSNLGPYDIITNSCVSHVCDVLQAGGVSTPAASGSSQLRFLLDLQKGN